MAYGESPGSPRYGSDSLDWPKQVTLFLPFSPRKLPLLTWGDRHSEDLLSAQEHRGRIRDADFVYKTALLKIQLLGKQSLHKSSIKKYKF